MIIRKEECRVSEVDNPVHLPRIQRHFLEGKDSFGAGRVFCTITVPAGSGEGKYHPHDGEYEIWHIISGKGTVCEDDKIYELYAGDTEICMPGSKHSIMNNGEEELIFLAIVLFDNSKK